MAIKTLQIHKQNVNISLVICVVSNANWDSCSRTCKHADCWDWTTLEQLALGLHHPTYFCCETARLITVSV